MIAAVIAVLVVGWWPAPVDAPVRGELEDVLRGARDAGVPAAVANYSVVEALANVALFVPVGAMLAAAVRPARWWIAPVLGLAVSGVVELGQLVGRPARIATGADLAANLCGALLGALLVVVVRAGQTVRRRRARSAAPRGPR